MILKKSVKNVTFWKSSNRCRIKLRRSWAYRFHWDATLGKKFFQMWRYLSQICFDFDLKLLKSSIGPFSWWVIQISLETWFQTRKRSLNDFSFWKKGECIPLGLFSTYHHWNRPNALSVSILMGERFYLSHFQAHYEEISASERGFVFVGLFFVRRVFYPLQ